MGKKNKRDSYTKEVEDRIMLECRAYRNTTGKVIKKIEVCNLDWGNGKVRLVLQEGGKLIDDTQAYPSECCRYFEEHE